MSNNHSGQEPACPREERVLSGQLLVGSSGGLTSQSKQALSTAGGGGGNASLVSVYRPSGDAILTFSA